MEKKYKTMGELIEARRARGKLTSKAQKERLRNNKTFYKIGEDGREYWNENTKLNYVTGFYIDPSSQFHARSSKWDLSTYKFPRTW